MERFITKHSILDVPAALDPPLVLNMPRIMNMSGFLTYQGSQSNEKRLVLEQTTLIFEIELF